jgi:hypothetical protein
VPLCDISALPGALDDQRCMQRLTTSNLRYKHGVLGTRLERMKGPAIAGLRARHTAWSLSFDADDDDRVLAALELYEIAIEMTIVERGGPRWDNSPDSDGTPVVSLDAGPAEAEGAAAGDLGIAPIPDPPPESKQGKKEPKSVKEYRQLYNRIGAALKKAKVPKEDRLVLAYKSLDFKAGLANVKIRHSFIATLKTIERQLGARKK